MALELAVVPYPGRSEAESRFGTLRERAGDEPWTHEVALVEHHHNDRIILHGTVAGRFVSVSEDDHFSQPGAAKGAAIGGLIGLVFFGGPAGLAPGLVVGTVVGGSLAEPTEVEDAPGPLLEHLRTAVPTGGSAILLVGEADHVDALLETAGPEAAARATRMPLARVPIGVDGHPAASAGPSEAGEVARTARAGGQLRGP